MSHAPATVVQIIGGQSQTVAARRIALRVIGAEARDVRLETRAADHPRTLIDDTPVPRVPRKVRDAIAALLREWPRGEDVGADGWRQPRLGEAFPDLGRIEGAAVEGGLGEVAVEEMPRDAALTHGAESQRVRTRQQWADEVPGADFAAIHVEAFFPSVPRGGEVVPGVAFQHSGRRAVDDFVVRGNAVAEKATHVAILTDAEGEPFIRVFVLLTDHALQSCEVPRPHPALERERAKRAAQSFLNMHVRSRVNRLRILRRRVDSGEHCIPRGIVHLRTQTAEGELVRFAGADAEFERATRSDGVLEGIRVYAGNREGEMRRNRGRRAGGPGARQRSDGGHREARAFQEGAAGKGGSGIHGNNSPHAF